MLQGFGISIVEYKSHVWELTDCYILPSCPAGVTSAYANAIHLSPSSIHEGYAEKLGSCTMPSTGCDMIMHDITPRGIYDHIQRVFLRRHAESFRIDQNVIALRATILLAQKTTMQPSQVTVIVLIEIVHFKPRALIFEAAKHQRLGDFLFADENLNSSVSWPYLRMVYPQVEHFENTICVRDDGDEKFQLTISFSRKQSLYQGPPASATHTLEVDIIQRKLIAQRDKARKDKIRQDEMQAWKTFKTDFLDQEDKI